jgi:glycosyltransferase involved in cell wall biosynthesis
MRIGINIDVARDETPSGIGLHIRELLEALAAIDEKNEYILYYRRGLTERRSGYEGPSGPSFRPRPVRAPKRWPEDHPSLWWDWYLPSILRRDRLDVFHGPNHFLPACRPARGVVTIHDLAYFRQDDLYTPEVNAALRTWTRRALDRASAVIALSENTRGDLEALGVPPERIRVIYGGGHVIPDDQIRYDRREELVRSLGLHERFILFVGTINPRKNVPFLLRGFAALKRRGDLPHKLVIAGARGAAAGEVDALIAELGLGSDVIVTGYLESWQIPLLYKMADLFVLPSLYEGFTLVTLEAMAYGTAVVATDTSSIREGVGDAARLVAIGDVEGMAMAIHAALTDEPLRRDMIARGRVQARKFTWENCARETLRLYREVDANVRAQTGPGRSPLRREPAPALGDDLASVPKGERW